MSAICAQVPLAQYPEGPRTGWGVNSVRVPPFGKIIWPLSKPRRETDSSPRDIAPASASSPSGRLEDEATFDGAGGDLYVLFLCRLKRAAPHDKGTYALADLCDLVRLQLETLTPAGPR